MDELKHSSNEWTPENLYHFFMRVIESNDSKYAQRFNDLQHYIQAAVDYQKESIHASLKSAETAVLKAEMASEKRFDAVNEFRNTLADQQRTLMPRSEAEIVSKGIDSRLDEISNKLMIRQGEKRGTTETYAGMVSIISIIIALASVLISFYKHT